MKNMFSRKQLGIPYGLFLVLFVAAPLLVLVYYAFTDGSGKFSITNLLNFFTDPNTLGTLCYSFVLAIVTTLVCLLIAYPVAYILAHSKIKRKAVILLLFVMPMWINFTLRITALKEILSLIEGNLAFYPFLNTVIGMTYDFLPFMILPLYTTLSKLDKSLIEAKALFQCGVLLPTEGNLLPVLLFQKGRKTVPLHLTGGVRAAQDRFQYRFTHGTPPSPPRPKTDRTHRRRIAAPAFPWLSLPDPSAPSARRTAACHAPAGHQ